MSVNTGEHAIQSVFMKSEIRTFLQVVISFFSLGSIRNRNLTIEKKVYNNFFSVRFFSRSLICAERTEQSFHWIEIVFDRCISLTKHREMVFALVFFYDRFDLLIMAMNGKTLSAWFFVAGSYYLQREHKQNETKWIWKNTPLKCFRNGAKNVLIHEK